MNIWMWTTLALALVLAVVVAWGQLVRPAVAGEQGQAASADGFEVLAAGDDRYIVARGRQTRREIATDRARAEYADSHAVSGRLVGQMREHRQARGVIHLSLEAVLLLQRQSPRCRGPSSGCRIGPACHGW